MFSRGVVHPADDLSTDSRLQIYTPANAHQQDVGEVHADIGLGRWILHSLQILVFPDAREYIKSG